MIAILDYGVGNLFSLRSSLGQLGLEAVVTADADIIRTSFYSYDRCRMKLSHIVSSF